MWFYEEFEIFLTSPDADGISAGGVGAVARTGHKRRERDHSNRDAGRTFRGPERSHPVALPRCKEGWNRYRFDRSRDCARFCEAHDKQEWAPVERGGGCRRRGTGAAVHSRSRGACKTETRRSPRWEERGRAAEDAAGGVQLESAERGCREDYPAL